MKNKNIKIFLTILIAVAIVIIGKSYFFETQKNNVPIPTQTADQTSYWKTYESKKFAFGFKFPGTWDVEEREEEILMFPVGEKHDYTVDGNTIMHVYLSADDQRQLDYLKSEYYKKAVELQIDGKNALKDSDNLFAIIKVDDDISIEVRGGDFPKNKNEAVKYFDQVLSTFKFLNDTDTSDWKTYTAVDSTFSFKFPAQWAVQPNQVFGSRSVTEFLFQNNPLFTVTMLGNYNQITGQPFKTLGEYLGARNTKSKEFLLDGIQAKRVTDPGQAGHVLPSEEVVVFSKDNKFIVSLYFEPNYYPQAAKDKILDQIISTFKFNN